MDNTIKVGMADIKISKHPAVLTTLGLGSCVGIGFYDRRTNMIGLAHIMLPYSSQARNNSNEAKFADTAIDKMLYEMLKAGCEKKSIIAKIAGGAQMFAVNTSCDTMRIGDRNVIATREKLSELRISIISEDTGGNFGRTIELYSENGNLLIKTIGHGIKVI
jgi:chemotaxis protein CheD